MENNELGVVSIKELVYNNLRTRIINGDLKPGSRLLESELSIEMNISRAPIREAFNMLEKDGFTKIIPRKGAIVSEITEEAIFSIWEMRLLIEPFVAKTTLHMIPDKDIEKLDYLMNYVITHPDDFEKYMESDLAIHDLISKYLDNPFMKSTLENIKAHSLRIRWADEYTSEGARMPETPVAVNKEHMKILKAMKERDENALFQAVKEHVILSTNRIMDACNIHLTDSQQDRMDILSRY